MRYFQHLWSLDLLLLTLLIVSFLLTESSRNRLGQASLGSPRRFLIMNMAGRHILRARLGVDACTPCTWFISLNLPSGTESSQSSREQGTLLQKFLIYPSWEEPPISKIILKPSPFFSPVYFHCVGCCFLFLFFHSFHCHRLLVSGFLLMLFPLCAFLLCTDEIDLHCLLRLFFCQESLCIQCARWWSGKAGEAAFFT